MPAPKKEARSVPTENSPLPRRAIDYANKAFSFSSKACLEACSKTDEEMTRNVAKDLSKNFY